MGIVTIAVAGGIVLSKIKAKKNKERCKSEMINYVADFNDVLCIYLESIRDGNLDKKTITNFMCSLDKIYINYEIGMVYIDFSNTQLNNLTNLVFDYTRKLAYANSIDFSKFEEKKSTFEDNTISNLKFYLEVQMQIFENN